MKVRMIASISGTRDGADWPPVGGEVVLPDGEARDLCAAGLASPVAEEPKAEKRPAAKRSEKR